MDMESMKLIKKTCIVDIFMENMKLVKTEASCRIIYQIISKETLTF